MESHLGETRSPGGLRVCILSRKELDRITRVVRQARALCDAGHRVTVVCFRRPMEELTATVPEVEWVEIGVDPWPRRFARTLSERRTQERRRRAAAERAALRDREASDATAASAATGRPRAILAAGRRLGRGLRRAFVAIPAAVLTRRQGQPTPARAREIAAMSPEQLAAACLEPLYEYAATRDFAARAREILRGRSFDLCQAHDNYSLLAAFRVARATGAALAFDATEISEHREVVEEGRSLYSRLVPRLERSQEGRLMRRAAFTIAVGDGVADWYVRRYGVPRPLVVRNCRYFRPHERREDIRRDCGVGPDERLVVWFGYAYPDQGIEHIVEAARHADPSLHFAVIADVLPKWEPFFASLQERIETLGLAGRVHFLPARDPEDLIAYISGGDLGIIPRRNVSLNVYYSMPNKLMEMVMGRLPVASSDLHDIRILIEKYGMGRIFDIEDPRDIARTLAEMVVPSTYAKLREGVFQAATELCWERESEAYVRAVDKLREIRPRRTPSESVERLGVELTAERQRSARLATELEGLRSSLEQQRQLTETYEESLQEIRTAAEERLEEVRRTAEQRQEDLRAAVNEAAARRREDLERFQARATELKNALDRQNAELTAAKSELEAARQAGTEALEEVERELPGRS